MARLLVGRAGIRRGIFVALKNVDMIEATERALALGLDKVRAARPWTDLILVGQDVRDVGDVVEKSSRPPRWRVTSRNE